MFGRILKNLRELAQETQREVAEAVYVSPSAISQYEKRKAYPIRATLVALAKHFHVSTDYLLGTSNDPNLEELMKEKYYGDVTVSDLVEKCLRVPINDRDTVLTIVDALIPGKNKGGNE